MRSVFRDEVVTRPVVPLEPGQRSAPILLRAVAEICLDLASRYDSMPSPIRGHAGKLAKIAYPAALKIKKLFDRCDQMPGGRVAS